MCSTVLNIRQNKCTKLLSCPVSCDRVMERRSISHSTSTSHTVFATFALRHTVLVTASPTLLHRLPPTMLDSLAPELIYMISDRLTLPSLASIVQTCHTLHNILTPEFYKRAVEDDNGLRGLQHATTTDNYALARHLLYYGADPNVSCDERTPLHIAAELGHVSIAHLLLQHGADMLLSCWEEHPEKRLYPIAGPLSALGYAVSNGHADVAELLLDEMERSGISKDVFSGETLFQIAAAERHTDVVRLFLKREMDPVALSWLMRDPLQRGYAEIVEMMIEAGADVEARPSTWRPLHSVAHKGHADVARVLLEHGAEVDALSHASHDQPKTPLVTAAKMGVIGPSERSLTSQLSEEDCLREIQRYKIGAWEVAKLLIEWGADVDWAIHLVHGLGITVQERQDITEFLEDARKDVNVGSG
jgi:ankyrin repeat protein